MSIYLSRVLIIHLVVCTSAATCFLVVLGTQGEIEAALEMINEKFPEKRFPNFSTQEISAELYQRLTPLVPEFLQVS